MDAVQTFFADPGTTSSWDQVVLFCQQLYYSTPFRVVAFIVVVMATVWMIAKIYSGELQNAEKGPVAVRKHKGTVGTIPRDTIVVPRDLISLTMDGVHAKCTFMYVYEGHRNKLVHEPLFTKSMRLSVSATKLPDRVVTIAKANEVPDVGTQEVYWPILDVELENPTQGERTADRAQDYARDNRVLDRWSGDDNLSCISVHDELYDELVTARAEFIDRRVKHLRLLRGGSWLQKLRHRDAARDRPGAVGNYYLKFQFSNDPAFVLGRHPDRDVRMTAWLTVLTSAFAIMMEMFSLRPVPPEGITPFFSSPASAEDSARARSARTRPVIP